MGRQQSAETRVKIGAANKGKKRSPEMRARMSTAQKGKQPWNKGSLGRKQTTEHRAKIHATRTATLSDPQRHQAFLDKCRANGVKSALAQAGRRSSCPEHYVRGYLTALGVDFVYQYPVAGFVADFYIPVLNVVLEYDGTWWHRKHAERDDARTSALIGLGYAVVRITEKTMDEVLRSVFGAARKADIIAEVVAP